MKYAASPSQGQSQGAVYEGAWRQGLPHGHGVMQDALGFYDGEWVRGQRHGKGKLVYRDGSVYEGQFEEDKRHGKGSLVAEGQYAAVYRGEWFKDVIQGRGHMEFSTGHIFDGNFFEGLPHGHGTLICPSVDGQRLTIECKWNKGVREGRTNVVHGLRLRFLPT